MILIAGLSKSGKTQTISETVRRNPRLRHLRASELLSREYRPLSRLTHQQVLENQDALLNAISKGHPAAEVTILLDGHAMIEAIDGPFLLPNWVFNKLSLQGIIAIVAPPDLIAARRNDSELEREITTLAQFQDLEVNHCRRQAERLAIAFATVRSGEIDEMGKTLTGMIMTH